MKRITIWRAAFVCGIMAVCGVLAGNAAAQTGRDAVSGLMLSDVHFDPFHDPGKVQRLVDGPVSEWGKILAGPASVDQAAAFLALQQRCGARGVDTPDALWRSSLSAARRQTPNAGFVTVSGDLIAHGFTCRYAVVVSGKTQSDYAEFVEKTVDYVTRELRAAFPGVPVYVALGNNDSGCGDYRLDGGSDFLTSVGKSVVAGLPQSAKRTKALSDFAAGGYYSVMMAAPMRNTRLIVLDDVFMSTKYTTCSGKQYPAAAAAQTAWLQKELAGARLRKEKVWVLGHIPPGINVYSTFAKMWNVCERDAPQEFLASDALGDVLAGNGDVVKLGIFAHTHMDEWRLLGAKGGGTAIRMISSISPVDGNNPSFTVAQVDAASAVLTDYAVFAASNQTGVNTSWSKEYDYSQTYHETTFSPAALKELIGEFRSDPAAKTDESRAYIKNFLAGDGSSLIKPLWPQYVCALSNYTAKGFAACVCPAVQ